MKKVLIALSLLLSFFANAQNETDFKQIDKGIYVFWFNQFENKVVIAEFEKFLAVVEFPHNDSVVNAIIQKTKEVFPSKPIKYVLHTHHHPHSISGFDLFLKIPEAQLVTSQTNFNEILKLTKDTIELKKRLILNDSLYIIKDKVNEMDCHIIFQNKYPVPTKEYNVFYFPKQRILISGCLYNKPITYHEVVTSRKPALKKFITDKNLDIKLLIPTNTCKTNGFEDFCTMQMLDSTLILGIKPLEYADHFQSKSIEYLESKSDSLITEFKKIPRDYDFIVVGNVLKSMRKDYNRAIILFHNMEKLYPKSVDIIVLLAESYELKGYTTEAIAYYQKSLSFLKEADDINEINKKITQLGKL